MKKSCFRRCRALLGTRRRIGAERKSPPCGGLLRNKNSSNCEVAGSPLKACGDDVLAKPFALRANGPKRHLILPSLYITCLRTTGSYFLTSILFGVFFLFLSVV